jgi:hypothetical protein
VMGRAALPRSSRKTKLPTGLRGSWPAQRQRLGSRGRRPYPGDGSCATDAPSTRSRPTRHSKDSVHAC